MRELGTNKVPGHIPLRNQDMAEDACSHITNYKIFCLLFLLATAIYPPKPCGTMDTVGLKHYLLAAMSLPKQTAFGSEAPHNSFLCKTLSKKQCDGRRWQHCRKPSCISEGTALERRQKRGLSLNAVSVQVSYAEGIGKWRSRWAIPSERSNSSSAGTVV